MSDSHKKLALAKEDFQRLSEYLRRVVPIMRWLNYATLVCYGVKPADAATAATSADRNKAINCDCD